MVIQNNGDDDWGEDEDEVDWGEDTSEDAVRRRMEALSGGLGGLVIDNDLEKPEGDRINIFHQFVKQKIQVNTGLKESFCLEIETNTKITIELHLALHNVLYTDG